MRTSYFLLGSLFALAGCSAKPVITNVSNIELGKTLPGLPMRVKTETIAHIYRFNPENSSNDQLYTEVSDAKQVLANFDQLFVVDVVTWPFVSPGLHVTEYSDNTLKSINITSTENQSGIIDAATQGLTGFTTAQNAKATACQTSNTAVVTADQALASARASYDALPVTATSQLKAAYQQ